MKDRFFLEIKKIKGVKIYKNVFVGNDTNLKINALFSYKIEITNILAIKKVFQIIKKHEKKYYIIGRGSNVLLSNDCYEGVLVKLMPISKIATNVVYAGDSLNYLNSLYLEQGISSLNFMSGVPCSIGGAIYMNAGAFDQTMSDIIEYVYVFDIHDMKFKVFDNEACQFSYRTSCFQTNKMIILGAKIKLIHEPKEQIMKRHHEILEIRKNKLPLEYPNLGSVFKNPPGEYSGKLIDDLGLKGLIVGGAKISDKHANIIVNYGDATGDDVNKLIDIIKEEVYMKYKIKLELEIFVFK